MELKDYYAHNELWSIEYSKYTKKWTENLSKSASQIDKEDSEAWRLFLNRDNVIASIGQGAFITKKDNGVVVLDQIKSIKDNWYNIAKKINEIKDYPQNDLNEVAVKIQEVKNYIIDIVGGKRNLAINRMLIAFFPDLLVNIPNETEIDKFIKLLTPFGFNNSEEINEDEIRKLWVGKSINIHTFVFEKINDKTSYIDFWPIYAKLKNMQLFDILKFQKNLILTGAPGTGKTFLAREIAAAMIDCTMEELKDNKQFGFVQFHPSYDYTDFVEGLRPQKSGSNIVFERKDGIFMDFCRKALSAYKEAQEKKEVPPKYVFVIDEINRGEISKIFGELFFSIDPDYRGVKGAVSTQYSNLWKDDLKKALFDDGEKFYVPENVYVIGTMNDIDRSVESMDFAFRRRFAFREIKAEDRTDDILGTLDPKVKDVAKKKMKAINDIIANSKELGLGQQYKLGPAYFMNIEKYDGADKWKSLWENHIEGVLREYLRGRPSTDIKEAMDKMEKAYNKPQNTGDNGEGDNTGGQSDNPESETEATDK